MLLNKLLQLVLAQLVGEVADKHVGFGALLDGGGGGGLVGTHGEWMDGRGWCRCGEV